MDGLIVTRIMFERFWEPEALQKFVWKFKNV